MAQRQPDRFGRNRAGSMEATPAARAGRLQSLTSWIDAFAARSEQKLGDRHGARQESRMETKTEFAGLRPEASDSDQSIEGPARGSRQSRGPRG